MADFIAPEIQDNANGWGPCQVPEKFKDMPYQPFGKTDRLGKVIYSENKETHVVLRFRTGLVLLTPIASTQTSILLLSRATTSTPTTTKMTIPRTCSSTTRRLEVTRDSRSLDVDNEVFIMMETRFVSFL